MTPTKEEIERRAREIYVRDCYRAGVPSLADVNPETSELRENGCWSQAVSELMTSVEGKNEKWINSVSETSDFSLDIQQLFESNALILGSRHTGKSDIAMMISDKVMLENAVVVVFDPSQDWITRSSIRNYVKVDVHTVLDVPSESVIYDLSLCSPLDQARIVENFAKNLFQCQAQASNRKQYLVIFEEAHTYFSQGCMRSKNLANCVRLLSVGRNVSVGCVLISQFASMLDKFAIKHSTSQAWFGFTREPNDLNYLKQILGSDVKELSKLNDGQFLYLTRNGISKIQIEPYASVIEKQEIAIPEPQALPNMEPRARTPNANITIARLILMAIFCALMAKVFI